MTLAEQLIEQAIDAVKDGEDPASVVEELLGEAKALSKVKKKMADSMWVISKDSTGAYIVTMGDPKKSSSKIKHRFSDDGDLKDWAKKTIDKKVSPDHMMDLSGMKLVPDVYSQFYVDMEKGKK